MSILNIGKVRLENNIILAPMAGVTDLPFRLLCRRQGAGMVCMEMISAKAIMYKNKNTEALLQIHPEEGPVSLQLFGSDADIIAKMAARIESRPFDVLDINMGCPVPKVVNNGEGSALMKDMQLAEEIVRKTVHAVKKPVTVKIRKGFDEEHVNAVELAKRVEEAGAAAITVHGRTREQYYSGKADWEIIAKVKEAVTIPVIGNGDIDSPEGAERMLRETGCDGIMIGRAARGNPWIFHEVVSYLEKGNVLNEPLTGQGNQQNRFSLGTENKQNQCSPGTGILPEHPSLEEQYKLIMEHAELMLEYKGEYTAVREMRKHISWYTAGIPHSAKIRGRVNAIETMAELRECIKEIFGRE